MIFSSQVPVNVTTPRLLVDYLAQRFTYHSREVWLELITAGKVGIEGKPASPDATIRGKQMIDYDAGDFEEPPADLEYSIIYEDEWLMAVNKPGNLLIHRAGRSFRNNLMYQLRTVHVPPYPTAYCIHRLDRNTSGIVLIAKSPELQAEISEQFAKRTIKKWYHAIVEGVPGNTVRQIDVPIAPDRTSTTGAKFNVDISGKEAVTIIERCDAIGTGFAHLLLRPLTGRTHQLRVHCAYIGHPIVGDRLYGSTTTFPGTSAAPSDTSVDKNPHPRHALHCGKICFFYCRKNEDCCIEAPLPADTLALEHYLQNTNKKGA